ncbi:MAG TPA: hypothetical protein VN903_15375 [Polyangia bacterium]|jgi:hypothetical protein|nr:hypothetical protein [Polyangia bacterium]
MTSGAVVLIALSLQTPIDAPEAAASTKARLELRGAADCISRADLEARVAARSSRIQFVDDAAIYARVVLAPARPGNVAAEVALATSGAEQPARRLVARSCAEAADAIALIIAVTLDPTLQAPTDQPVAAPPPAPPVIVETPALPPPITQPPAARRQFGAAVAGQTIAGPAPAIMPGIALYGMAAVDRDSVWSPALFLGATHVWRNDLSEQGGTASFTLDAASLDVCPLRVGRTRFVARPCASVLVGRLAASGAETDQAASAARPFATAGVAVTASYGTTVEVVVRVVAGMTLIRDAYEFGAMTFHRASAVTVAANLGVGLRWP